MAFVRAIKVGGNFVPASVGPTKTRQERKRFDPATESTSGAILRNLFKPVRETIATAGGAPGSLFNLLGSLVSPVQKLTSGEFLDESSPFTGGIPQVPRGLTIPGVRENVSVPLGESLFGEGSQEPQPGFIEGVTERAAQFAPATALAAITGGASGIGSGLRALGGGGLTNLLQGLTGESLERAGVGPIGQFAGEVATGALAPTAGKLLGTATKRATARVAKRLTANENRIWSAVDDAATKAGAQEAVTFEKSLVDAETKLKSTVAQANRKSVQTTIEEAAGDILNNKIDATRLVGTRKKINDLLRTTKSGAAKAVLKDIKNSVDETLGKSIGNLNLDAAKATIAKREFLDSDAYKTLIKKTTDRFGKAKSSAFGEVITKIAPYGAAIGAAALKSPLIAASAIGVPIGSRIIKNASIILNNPQLRAEALRAIGKIGAKSALSTTSAATLREPSAKRRTRFIRG